MLAGSSGQMRRFPSSPQSFRIVDLFFQDAMKETLVKQEIKQEWEDGQPEEGSPRVTANDEQSAEPPRTVITARRHVRTITTAGHITETVAEPDPASPDASGIPSNLQLSPQQHHQHQHRQQFQQQTTVEQQPRQSRSRNFHEDEQQESGTQQASQDYLQISQSDVEIQQQPHRPGEQRVVYLTSNGQEVQVEVPDTVDPATLAVKESAR